MRRERFARQGHLSIAPSALSLLFDVPEPKGTEVKDGIAVVTIQGPLTHHGDWWWDSYDSIRERVIEAFASAAQTVVLRIDSPGGDVSGCFELSRDIRMIARETGKRLVAYADGMACSAAYALACSAGEIYAPPSGYLGSVGVISVLVDTSKADAEAGYKFEVITSGRRKADGCPYLPISKEAVDEIQGQVNSLADLFFDLVAESRGTAPDKVQALEAAVFHGEKAVQAGLATGVVQSFDALLAMLAAGEMAPEAKETVAMTYKELLAELKKMAEEGEGEDKESASKLLKKAEGEEEPPKDDKAEGEDDEHKEPDGDEAEDEKPADKAEGEEPDGDEEPKKDGKAKGSKASVAAIVKAEVKKEVKTIRDDAERDRLLAARPDLPKDTAARLAKKPLAFVKEVLALTPKPAPTNPAAAAVVQGTRGKGQVNSAAVSAEFEDMDRAFGRPEAARPAIEHEGNMMFIGAITSQERERLSKGGK
jgi:ClpP class serine protease